MNATHTLPLFLLLAACASGTEEDTSRGRGGHAEAPAPRGAVDPNGRWECTRAVATDLLYGYAVPDVQFVPDLQTALVIERGTVAGFDTDQGFVPTDGGSLARYVGALGYHLDYVREDVRPDGVSWSVGFSGPEGFVDTELELSAQDNHTMTGNLTNWQESWDGRTVKYSAWRVEMVLAP